jgi:hypothetical protein
MPHYIPRIASEYSSRAEKMPFDFSDIIAALAPRPFFACAPLHDMFDVTGAKECLAIARRAYDAMGAAEKLNAIFPDCGHDFPEEAQEAAYAWLEHWS